MRIKLIFIIISFVSLCNTISIQAQSCRDLYLSAKTLEKEGKLDKARSLYVQVVACGDKFYADECKPRIEWIDRIRRNSDTTKPFAISDYEIVIPCQGGQDVITVDGNGAWQAKLADDRVEWCKIRSGKGKVLIISEANDNNADRECEVIVMMGGKSKRVKVINLRAPERLESSAKSISFPSSGDTQYIEIQSNTQWVLKDVPDWITSNQEDGNITLTAFANDVNTERIADIKIEGTSKTVIVNIYQGAGLDKLTFSKNDLYFGADGGDEYINVYTDATDWRLGDFPHWCQVTRVADNLLRVHCTPNEPFDLPREASVNVTTGKQTLGINVTQAPKPMVHVIPMDGIGGKAISWGMSVGYVSPMVVASSGSSFTGSAVNYALGNNTEEASYTTQNGFAIEAFADIRLYKNVYLKAGLEYIQYKYRNLFIGDVLRRAGHESKKYQKGVTQNNYEESYSMSMLNIPLLASYRIPICKGGHVQINAGPVVSCGLSAKMELAGNTDANDIREYKIVNNQMTDILDNAYHFEWHYSGRGELDLYSTSAKYTELWTSDVLTNSKVSKDCELEAVPMNRINWGARIGASFEYMGVSLGLEYNMMLTNMGNKKYWVGDRWTIFDQCADVVMSGYKQHNNYLTLKLGYTFRY